MNFDQIAYNIAAAIGLEKNYAVLQRVKFTFNYYRELLIRREMERNAGVSAALVQVIPKTELHKVPVTGSDVDTTIFGELWRTASIIPRPVRLKYREGFHYVGSIDRKTPYTEINSFELAWVHHFKYTAKLPRFFYQEGHLYVINATPEAIRIEAIFADPTRVPGFSEDNYPVTGDIVKYITEGLVKGEFEVLNNEDGRIKINE